MYWTGKETNDRCVLRRTKYYYDDAAYLFFRSEALSPIPLQERNYSRKEFREQNQQAGGKVPTSLIFRFGEQLRLV